MTVSEQVQPRAAEPLASQRAELLVRVSAAQYALEAAIAALNHTGTDSALLTAALRQSSALASLSDQIATADDRALGSLHSSVIAAVEASHVVAQQAKASATGGNETDLVSQHAATRQALQNIATDLFGKKVLDPYLQFTSAEDEEHYRKREKERDAEIKRLLASGTPEGERRALDLMHDQLRDAKAHGAGHAPEFDSLEKQIASVRDALQPIWTEQNLAEAGNAATSQPASTALDDVMAALKAAGVETAPGAQPSNQHGLADAALAVGPINVGRA